MRYINGGKLNIKENSKVNKKVKIERPIIPSGTIVFCRGTSGAGSFYGMVYSKGVLELSNGSDAYINTSDYIHLGDKISYWVVEKVVKATLTIEGIVEEMS